MPIIHFENHWFQQNMVNLIRKVGESVIISLCKHVAKVTLVPCSINWSRGGDNQQCKDFYQGVFSRVIK